MRGKPGPLNIHVKGDAAGDKLVLSLLDNGAGMPAQRVELLGKQTVVSQRG